MCVLKDLFWQLCVLKYIIQYKYALRHTKNEKGLSVDNAIQHNTTQHNSLFFLEIPRNVTDPIQQLHYLLPFT